MAATETFASRQADYQNFIQRSQWIAGGVLAVIAVGAQLFATGSAMIGAAVLTCALLTGSCAAYARVEFAWAASKLDVARQIANADLNLTLPRDLAPWPDRAQNLRAYLRLPDQPRGDARSDFVEHLADRCGFRARHRRDRSIALI